MGAYTYCVKCKEGQDPPTLAERLKRRQRCVHCGSARELDIYELQSGIDELIERLERIEAWMQDPNRDVPR